MTCYYLYISKNQSPNTYASSMASNASSLASKSLLNALSADLDYINKVIEDTINAYKMEIFWDNLTISMMPTSSSNSTSGTNLASSASAAVGQLQRMPFTVNCDELEQILNTSQKIDVTELDPSLSALLSSCFLIREKIIAYLKSTNLFDRHFIYTRSNSVEYVILLINDELIRNFR